MSDAVPGPGGGAVVDPTADRFEAAYQSHDDPWDFTTSPYEQRRYELTVATLPRPRYRRAFEPGCSIGELTARLASRCDTVVARDAAPTAVARARQRLAVWPGVDVDQGMVPGDWPEGRFDLVVLCELGYYLSADELAEVARRSLGSLAGDGTFLAGHWRGTADDQVQHGDEVHRQLAQLFGAAPTASYVEAAFRLDVWDWR